MKALFDQGAPEPCPDPFNLAAYVLQHAGDLPDKIALSVMGVSGSERWSYRSLNDAVLGTATGLLQCGLVEGDVVLLRLGNTVDFPIAYLGAIAVGLIPVPTSSQLTECEVRKIAEQVSPKLVLQAPGVACPQDIGCQIVAQDKLREFRDLPNSEFVLGDPNRLAYILFTSGTSGNSRAVAHAHRAIWARQMMWQDWYDLKQSDRLLHAGAFNWSFTLGTGLMDPWSVGATALIPAEGTPLTSLPLLLKRHDATIFAAAPGVYRKLLHDHPKLDLPKLRHGLSAGEKISATIRAEWEEATGKEVHEAFGMSECSTFISGSPSHPAHNSLGRPQNGRRIAILGSSGPVDIGEEGVIAVSNRDPGLMLGYLGAEDETSERFQEEWFLTGDLGIMDEGFEISYRGRADDMMNAGGFRVSPLEVEASLSGFSGIKEVAVTDIEIKSDTKVIAAFYVANQNIDEDELRKFAEERLARYKQPRIYQQIEVLPRGTNNKLLRRELKLSKGQHT